MSNKNIDEITNNARKSYYREWRANNKDKVKVHRQNFFIKKALATQEGVNKK